MEVAAGMKREWRRACVPVVLSQWSDHSPRDSDGDALATLKTWRDCGRYGKGCKGSGCCGDGCGAMVGGVGYWGSRRRTDGLLGICMHAHLENALAVWRCRD